MKQRITTILLLCAIAALILDSRCAAQAARDALELCWKTLIPGLFPLFVVSAMLVPSLKGARIPGLARLLGIPQGSEGIFVLGSAGGFPVGAACIAQAVSAGNLSQADGRRMLGFCSSCGPSFLFGVLAAVLSTEEAAVLFLLQLETAVLVACFWPGKSRRSYHPTVDSISLTDAVRRSIGSMSSVCAWVVLAGVVTGFLGRWLFPLLPQTAGILLTGLLELTNGVFSLNGISDGALRFLLCAVFTCFGGVSVLLQIRALAAPAGLEMESCICQKALQALLGGVLAWAWLRFGAAGLFIAPAVTAAKIAVEIPGTMVYNVRRKEGI